MCIRDSYTDAEGNTTTKKYYDTEALSQIDSDNVYVGMFASRTFDVTYSDISLTTIDPADDAPAEERPVEYKDIQVSVTSSSTASSEDYTFKGMSNADGHVVVTKGDDVIGETDVTANESLDVYKRQEYRLILIILYTLKAMAMTADDNICSCIYIFPCTRPLNVLKHSCMLSTPVDNSNHIICISSGQMCIRDSYNTS